MVQQVWHAFFNVKMHAGASAIPRTGSARKHATRKLVSASAPASNPAPLPCYNLKRSIMVQQVWHALVKVQMLKMHARASAIPRTGSARANAMRQLVIASPPASNPAPLPCYNLKRSIIVQQVWHALVNVQMLKMHARAR